MFGDARQPDRINRRGDLGLLFVRRDVQVGIKIAQHHQNTSLWDMVQRAYHLPKTSHQIRRRQIRAHHVVPGAADLELERDAVGPSHRRVLELERVPRPVKY